MLSGHLLVSFDVIGLEAKVRVLSGEASITLDELSLRDSLTAAERIRSLLRLV